ncbi:hypothetical protein XENORESO_001311 [Xenotaenia resolanae]|uniref:Uncharacterized protein n=1 Tax=Xenotaenia resolanae TaxID=208358 RepID=A0ABV0W8N4_9TELE
MARSLSLNWLIFLISISYSFKLAVALVSGFVRYPFGPESLHSSSKFSLSSSWMAQSFSLNWLILLISISYSFNLAVALVLGLVRYPFSPDSLETIFTIGSYFSDGLYSEISFPSPHSSMNPVHHRNHQPISSFLWTALGHGTTTSLYPYFISEQ